MTSAEPTSYLTAQHGEHYATLGLGVLRLVMPRINPETREQNGERAAKSTEMWISRDAARQYASPYSYSASPVNMLNADGNDAFGIPQAFYNSSSYRAGYKSNFSNPDKQRAMLGGIQMRAGGIGFLGSLSLISKLPILAGLLSVEPGDQAVQGFENLAFGVLNNSSLSEAGSPIGFALTQLNAPLLGRDSWMAAVASSVAQIAIDLSSGNPVSFMAAIMERSMTRTEAAPTLHAKNPSSAPDITRTK